VLAAVLAGAAEGARRRGGHGEILRRSEVRRRFSIALGRSAGSLQNPSYASQRLKRTGRSKRLFALLPLIAPTQGFADLVNWMGTLVYYR
jgi:hypothetical protein